MPNKTYRMLWEFWGKIISGQRDKQSLCGRGNLLVLSPGGISDGKMGNTFWEERWCISFDSLRSRHQDRSRHSKDLWEPSVKDKGETWDVRERPQIPMGNARLTPVKARAGRSAEEAGGLRLQHTSERVRAGQCGVLRPKPPFRAIWVSQEWAALVLTPVCSVTSWE